MDVGFDFAVAPASTSLHLENWAQCDSCGTWRLLPLGLNTEKLPDKWLCSMQTWLPGMNHCGDQQVDQKAKWRSAGTDCQIKTKKKKEGDKQESDGSKHITTGVGNKLARGMKVEEIHWNQDPEWTPAERKTKRPDNDFHTLDIERDTKKRLLASKSKPDHKRHLPTASGSLCTKAHCRINTPVRKIRLMGSKQGSDGNSLKLFADSDQKEPSMVKATINKISVQESKACQRNELFQAGGSHESETFSENLRARSFY
ncbi:PREDICTED: uncharacterized protein LOC104765850 isoform X2 [Camelina sativa]|uniref:Uncharacterized protein LOC104765850 isoform X2 n=1 Tax=Camelina sativa TaxID=90675 RepID=A0ABM0XM14_CAMSA|nr:PREDICTED: uncharacterized protein LOC104765850 isoform X2 [Camelina sativa]XP_010487930.1 PREDICTED: uncharacterized protein LOC104765850 isoform X2 [Camelina sativa]